MGLLSDRIKGIKERRDPDKVRKMLSDNLVIVEFTKANGDRRVMRATRNMQIINEVNGRPSEYVDTAAPKNTNKDNPDLVRLYDVDAKDWRSVKMSSLLKDPKIIERNDWMHPMEVNNG